MTAVAHQLGVAEEGAASGTAYGAVDAPAQGPCCSRRCKRPAVCRLRGTCPSTAKEMQYKSYLWHWH